MYIDEYVKFHQMLGNRVIWRKGVPFGEYRRGFLWSLPYHQPYDLAVADLQSLLWGSALGAIGVCPSGRAQRTTSFCTVTDTSYDFPSLQPRKRNQARRGLKECEVRQIDWGEMQRLGLEINREALLRQERHSSRLANPEWWERQCSTSAHFPDVRSWGAYVDGELASYVNVVIHDRDNPPAREANIVHFMSGNRHLKHNPNEALIFTVTRELLTNGGCQRVVLGSGSDDPNLLQWKRYMGYELEPFGYHLVANPALHVAKLFIPKLRLWMDGTMLGGSASAQAPEAAGV